jgi:hypothetical protein
MAAKQKLPQIKADPNANVNVHDYSTAGQLSQRQLIEMGDIAQSRGETDAAFRWKSMAAERQRVEENKTAMDRQFEAFKPQRVPAHGGQIIDAAPNVPWSADPEFKRLAAELVNVKARIEATPESQKTALLDLQNRKAGLADGMKERQEAVTEGMKAAGVWTEQDERTLAAEKSMVKKAKLVEKQVQ